MLDWFYEYDLIYYPITIVLVMGMAEAGARLGHWHSRKATETQQIGSLTGASLGLLALLLGFSFSLALARHDARRTLVLEEANAIGTTANYAQMLPEPERGQIRHLLRDYTQVRIGLGIPFDPAKLKHDVARSLDLQNRLWQLADTVTAAAPQSLPAYRFVASLNEMTNIHERRLTALRYHIPGPVMFTLVGVAMIAMGFTGYYAGVTGSRRYIATLIMSLTISMVIMLVLDLDSPARGMIRVPVQALVDTAQSLEQ